MKMRTFDPHLVRNHLACMDKELAEVGKLAPINFSPCGFRARPEKGLPQGKDPDGTASDSDTNKVK